DMGLITANPFRGVRCRQGTPARAIGDDEFRRILKPATPAYRRALFALRWTGCRPGELCRLTWAHVRWEDRIAVLAAGAHKPGKKTGKPRLIVLDDRMMNLLVFLRAHREPPAAEAMRRILAGGPLHAKELVRRMQAAGFSYRSMFCARRALDVEHCRLGRGRGSAYRLPPDQKPDLGEPDCDAFIFLNNAGTRWNRHTLARNLMCLRPEAEIPRDARQYGLRHRFGTNGAKSGLNLLALAALMGHAKVTTTQH